VNTLLHSPEDAMWEKRKGYFVEMGSGGGWSEGGEENGRGDGAEASDRKNQILHPQRHSTGPDPLHPP